jgi:hypothetical protein
MTPGISTPISISTFTKLDMSDSVEVMETGPLARHHTGRAQMAGIHVRSRYLNLYAGPRSC